jgi:ATP-dependent DNA helicase RecG
MEKSLATPIRYLKGIGPERARAFNKIVIFTLEDMLYYFPNRYQDRRKFSPIRDLKEGEFQTIKARVLRKSQRRSWRRRGFSILELVVADETKKLFCVWFNQPYLAPYFNTGQTLILYGKVQRYLERLQMNSPEFEIISEEGQDHSLHVGRITPIYSLPERISQRNFRQLIKQILDEYLIGLKDFLPYDIRSKNNLLNLPQSLINIHFPQDFDLEQQAYRRLSFEEFFLFQLPLVLRKLKNKTRSGIAHQVQGELVDSFIAHLPFKLTASQQKVISEIKYDLASQRQMQRLLHGEVGSGKTAVATIASLMALQGGFQVAFMVPTEILAKQHYDKIKSQCQDVRNSAGKKIKLGLLTGSLKDNQRKKVFQEIEKGKIDLVIGTHALLEERLNFKNLGLVVIDEQHKFGVGQRALLPKKGGNPDCLIMTATPIPRTLAITLYGDLDISVIGELPPGRPPVKTLNFSAEQKAHAYDIAINELKRGNQVYIVYPVIEQSYALDIAGAKKMFGELSRGAFKDFRLGLIHGRMKQGEQDKVMSAFKNKDLEVLVATTVLEVGIDIPEATCMIVEYAERFGLAQLHQLRGRIGRGSRESFCILISDASTPQAKARLQAMVKYSDGFKIAEEDLKIRGPGEFFGRRQHGLSELKIGDPLTQMQLLRSARLAATRLLNSDPRLEARQNALLKERLLQRFPEYEKLMLVG